MDGSDQDGGRTRSNIRESCIAEAKSIIASNGLEALSLREVARRLKVSHQAPYKHFASRDHLLAEIIRRCLRDFADALRASAVDEDGRASTPAEGMRRIGRLYLDYAASHPLEYRLMFATKWPVEADGNDLKRDARAAFDVLRERIAALEPRLDAEALDLEAMFVWSSIHGIASAIESEAMSHLDFPPEKARAAIAHAMARLEAATLPRSEVSRDPSQGRQRHAPFP